MSSIGLGDFATVKNLTVSDTLQCNNLSAAGASTFAGDVNATNVYASGTVFGQSLGSAANPIIYQHFASEMRIQNDLKVVDETSNQTKMALRKSGHLAVSRELDLHSGLDVQAANTKKWSVGLDEESSTAFVIKDEVTPAQSIVVSTTETQLKSATTKAIGNLFQVEGPLLDEVRLFVDNAETVINNGLTVNGNTVVEGNLDVTGTVPTSGPSYYFQGRTPTALTTRTGANTGEYKDLDSLTNQVIRSHTSMFNTGTGVFVAPVDGVYSFQYHVTFSASGADTISNANVRLQKYSGGSWNSVSETSHYPGSPDDIGEVCCNGTSMQSLIAGEQIKVVTYIAWSSSNITMRYMNGTGLSGVSLF